MCRAKKSVRLKLTYPVLKVQLDELPDDYFNSMIAHTFETQEPLQPFTFVIHQWVGRTIKDELIGFEK